MTGTEQVASASPNQCPECGGPITTTDREAVCEECGLVVGEHTIDHGPDWRNFEDGPDTRRASPTTSLRHDSGLGTTQSPDVTVTGVLEGQLTGRAHDTKEIYLRREVCRIGSKLDWAVSHKERGGDLVGQLYGETGCLGRDADTVAAAICWLVARVFGMGLSPDDVVAPARDVDCDAMLRRAQGVKRELGLSVPVADYEARVRRVGDTLNLDHATVEAAVRRVRDLDGTAKSGQQPSSVAATALYIESGETQESVADAAGTSPASIRNQFEHFGFDGGAYHG